MRSRSGFSRLLEVNGALTSAVAQGNVSVFISKIPPGQVRLAGFFNPGPRRGRQGKWPCGTRRFSGTARAPFRGPRRHV